jgi:hypothetical protein
VVWTKTKWTPVLYVASEGIAGARLVAWTDANDLTPDDLSCIYFWNAGVQVVNEAVLKRFIAAARIVGFGLIVLDTLANCFVGLDENSAQDMGRFTAALRKIQNSVQAGGVRCAVMVVHHTGKDGKEARGSSALKAGIDAELSIKSTRISQGCRDVSIVNSKQREDGEFEDIKLRLVPVPVTMPDGSKRTSCVLRDPSAADASSPDNNGISDALRRILQALADAPGATATTGQWAKRAGHLEKNGKTVNGTQHNHRRALTERAEVEKVKEGTFRVTARARRR